MKERGKGGGTCRERQRRKRRIKHKDGVWGEKGEEEKGKEGKIGERGNLSQILISFRE